MIVSFIFLKVLLVLDPNCRLANQSQNISFFAHLLDPTAAVSVIVAVAVAVLFTGSQMWLSDYQRFFGEFLSSGNTFRLQYHLRILIEAFISFQIFLNLILGFSD